jgi:hypothetical protein
VTPVLFAAAVALLLASGAVGALVLAYALLLRWCDRRICRWSNLTDDAPRHRADPDPLRLPWQTKVEEAQPWVPDPVLLQARDDLWRDAYGAQEGPSESGCEW